MEARWKATPKSYALPCPMAKKGWSSIYETSFTTSARPGTWPAPFTTLFAGRPMTTTQSTASGRWPIFGRSRKTTKLPVSCLKCRSLRSETVLWTCRLLPRSLSHHHLVGGREAVHGRATERRTGVRCSSTSTSSVVCRPARVSSVYGVEKSTAPQRIPEDCHKGAYGRRLECRLPTATPSLP